MASVTIPHLCLRASTINLCPARAFLSIATRRSIHTSSSRLDFLIPSLKSCTPSAALPSKRQENKRSIATAASATYQPAIPLWDDPPPPKEEDRQTIAIHNPQRDENESLMGVEITTGAAKRLQHIMHKDGNDNLALRVTVEGGGCIGFQYKMELVTLPAKYGGGPSMPEDSPTPKTSSSSPNAMPSSSTSPGIPAATSRNPTTAGPWSQTKEVDVDETDTIFTPTDGTKAKVIMNRVSLEVLKGSKVDFTSALIGSQFVVTGNPRLKSACGCGNSFDIVDEP